MRVLYDKSYVLQWLLQNLPCPDYRVQGLREGVLREKEEGRGFKGGLSVDVCWPAPHRNTGDRAFHLPATIFLALLEAR